MPDPVLTLLPIRAIAAMTGINAITLRTWERRYGLIQPRRTASGHRLYTHADIEEIRRVVSLMAKGVPISQVGEILATERSTSGRVQHRWQRYIEQILAAVSRFDEADIDRVYDEALSLYSVGAVTRRLILPVLGQLGRRWQSIDGAIAEEHFFATYFRSKLGARLQHRTRHAGGPRLLAACAPGEHHEIGLLLFSLEAHEAGLRTVLLGADTPLKDIALAQRHAGCDAIVVSSSIDPLPALFSEDLPALIRSVSVPVFVGGATSQRHARTITAAGAVALGSDIEHGIELLKDRLTRKENPL